MKTLHSSNIKLSVIMPLYNQENLFRIGLDSIPARDDIEIIIVDDGSTDNSLEEAKNYQMNSKKNIVVLSNGTNKGVAYSVNRGLDVATGEYIVLLGSDGDYFVNLGIGMEYIDGSDLIYFNLQVNSGEFWDVVQGSCKFMRREFIGDTRVPLLINCEDNAFFSLLRRKNPIEKHLGRDIMYKHYNYPREGSLAWQVEHHLVEGGKKCF